MKGPMPAESHAILRSPETDWSLFRLRQQLRYVVVQQFVDADGDVHPVGETWVFLSTMFDRQTDLLLLCMRLADGTEWQIPLFWKPNAQQVIIENLHAYIRSVESED